MKQDNYITHEKNPDRICGEYINYWLKKRDEQKENSGEKDDK